MEKREKEEETLISAPCKFIAIFPFSFSFFFLSYFRGFFFFFFCLILLIFIKIKYYNFYSIFSRINGGRRSE